MKNITASLLLALALCSYVFVAPTTVTAEIISVDITGSWAEGNSKVNQATQGDYTGVLDGTVLGVSPSGQIRISVRARHGVQPHFFADYVGILIPEIGSLPPLPMDWRLKAAAGLSVSA